MLLDASPTAPTLLPTQSPRVVAPGPRGQARPVEGLWPSLCRGGTSRDKKGALSNNRSCLPPLPLRDKGTDRLPELKAAFMWRKLKPFPTHPVRNEPQKGQCHCRRYVSGKSNEVTLLSPLLPSNLSTVPATGEIQSKVSYERHPAGVRPHCKTEQSRPKGRGGCL